MEKTIKWLIPQILVFFILGFKAKIFLAFLFIIIHEFCHFVVAVKIGVNVQNFKVHPLGTTLEISEYDELSPKEEILICIAGPIANIIMVLIFFCIKKYINIDFINNCIEINLVLGIFNLIPAFPLDGSKILKAILSRKMLYKTAYGITIIISYIISILFIALFFLELYIHNLNLSLILAGIFIIYTTYKEKERIMYIIMSDIIRKRKRLLKNKYIENKFLSVYYKQELLYILGLVDKNKFNIFYILNEEMKLLYTLSEDEVLEALKIYGNITLEEYVDIKSS
ncbi:stage IV sporulation protein FB [Clostridium cavendishii DSM 21758]|uniref:Stage IV sporulation protein FB n=1 Tax=Clostridium cavendishii DSM 21758 TaxID=1121302 RepID=A0A1M6BJB5_9CLOT|nr:site-2 protease family protein [Clostridium cavendishii]SHI48809.1 stage IV sporulation protein FB [Clostridium cavendishii DSM 21758]